LSKVLITGSGGVVGTVLTRGLEHDITGFDLPEHDILDLAQLQHMLPGHDAVVHLAWASKRDNWLTELFEPKNLEGAHNVFEAAQHAGVKRVIVASSVHADDFVHPGKEGLLDPYSLPVPDSPYGAAKCMIEALGRYYASAKNLEVICVRLGGINKDDTPPDSPPSERQVWISHRDLLRHIEACLAAPSVPNNYAITYAVGNNEARLHDIQNPFNWQPQDGTTLVP
jgi:nucleoside-diphosphate-sugar epimerase